MRLRVLSGALALLLLAACGGELQTPGEALRIFGDSLDQAYVGEPYEEAIRAVGGLRPFSYQLAEGELPPGLSLEAGVISGVPTQTGSYGFTISVSDANLSRTFQEYELAVVERPPPVLTLLAPETEIREPVTVRLRVENATELRAVSALLSWDPSDFALVEGSLESATDGTALMQQANEGSLHLEMAALGRPWNGEVVLARFTLAPLATARLHPRVEALFIDDRDTTIFQDAGGAAGKNDADELEEADEVDDTDGADEPVDDGGPAAAEETP